MALYPHLHEYLQGLDLIWQIPFAVAPRRQGVGDGGSTTVPSACRWLDRKAP